MSGGVSGDVPVQPFNNDSRSVGCSESFHKNNLSSNALSQTMISISYYHSCLQSEAIIRGAGIT